MELFYSDTIQKGTCILNEEEARHCIKVLRHVAGDVIHVIDGRGGLHECRILEGKKEVLCEILSTCENFGIHEYQLVMAVAPTKNIDRYEWFLEKATEIGVDTIVPVIGEHSERKIVKPERLHKILLSAAKQSLKGGIPVLREAESVVSFIKKADQLFSGADGVLKLIAYCGSAEKISLKQAVEEYMEANTNHFGRGDYSPVPRIAILIGPEGDFSEEEVRLAMEKGFKPIHLGNSRLRTETAAVAAVSCVYFVLGGL